MEQAMCILERVSLSRRWYEIKYHVPLSGGCSRTVLYGSILYYTVQHRHLLSLYPTGARLGSQGDLLG